MSDETDEIVRDLEQRARQNKARKRQEVAIETAVRELKVDWELFQSEVWGLDARCNGDLRRCCRILKRVGLSNLEIAIVLSYFLRVLGNKCRTRKHSHKPRWCRNLSRRLAKPARLRGRVQMAAKRVLYLYGTATTSDVIDYAYALQLLILGERRRNDFNRAARRSLEAIGAVKIARERANGPWLWRMPTDAT